MSILDSVRPITVFFLLLLLLVGCGGDDNGSPWSFSRNGQVLEIAYGQGTAYPQYGALHLDSSFFRLNYGPGSGWGTSVVLMPAFWENGRYFQGANISANVTESDDETPVIDFSGQISGLSVTGKIRLSPPANNTISTHVSINTTGTVNLDNRHNEAFKPTLLSSMHISDTHWDASDAFVDDTSYAIPAQGWVLQPPITSQKFGLIGGTSNWKTNAPTVGITLDRLLPVTGWVTSSNDPNDDNFGLWATTDTVLPSWEYVIQVKP